MSTLVPSTGAQCIIKHDIGVMLELVPHDKPSFLQNLKNLPIKRVFLKVLLKLSQKPFSHGLPVSMYTVLDTNTSARDQVSTIKFIIVKFLSGRLERAYKILHTSLKFVAVIALIQLTKPSKLCTQFLINFFRGQWQTC